MIDEYLIKRVKAFNFPILCTADISNLEHVLGVNFSKEFWELSKIADFEYFNAFNINNLNQLGNSSVIGDTLRLRDAISLPKNVLFLSEDDASVLLMKCFGDKEEIYWIAIEDIENFCEHKPLLYNPTIFLSFVEFFEYLVKQEEESTL